MTHHFTKQPFTLSRLSTALLVLDHGTRRQNPIIRTKRVGESSADFRNFLHKTATETRPPNIRTFRDRCRLQFENFTEGTRLADGTGLTDESEASAVRKKRVA